MDRKLGGLIASVALALVACSQPEVVPPPESRSPEADNFMAGSKVMSPEEALATANRASSPIPLHSARGACLIALKRTLHDPKSAEFGLVSEWSSTIDSDGRVRVLPRFRAKNAYGSMRLVTFSCVVESAGGDQLRIAKLEQID